MMKKFLFFITLFLLLENRLVYSVEIDSKYGLLYDYTTNEIVFAKNIDTPHPPSSLTKLMTAYIVFDKIKKNEITLDTKFFVSIRAWRQEGSRMFLEPEWKVNIDELLKGLIVVSGNDAAVALAEGVSGNVEDFVKLMNETAKKIGMVNTNFVNPTGLHDKNHYSTVKDLLVLSIAIIDSFPDFYEKYFSITEYRFNNLLQKNRNTMLLRYPGTDGLKTGNTGMGGFALIASAKKNRQRFISIVNGAKDDDTRFFDSIGLMDYGFDQYQYIELAKKNEPIVDINTIMGDNKSEHFLYAKEDVIIYPVKKDKVKNLKVNVIYDINNYTKAKKGDKVGVLRFIENDRIEEYDLYTSGDIEGMSTFSQFFTYFKRNCRTFF